MDKETLSNYGWIVICVLVLAVMIALAGPFGNFISDAVKSTTQGLFDVNQNALDAAGITIADQTFWEAQNGAKVYYDRVYETELNGAAGIWYRDGSFALYYLGQLVTVPANQVIIEGNRISSPDPMCPSQEWYFEANTDGTVVAVARYSYYDYDTTAQIYLNKDYIGMQDANITEYTSIEAWLASK